MVQLLLMQYAVYILRCSDGSYYTGVTNDVEARVSQHNLGTDASAYTFTRRPVKLVYTSWFTEVLQAIEWEKRIKRWSRKKKEALIRGEYEVLPELAKNIMQRSIRFIQKEVHRQIMLSQITNVSS